jgi:hypothetical protein
LITLQNFTQFARFWIARCEVISFPVVKIDQTYSL